MHDITELEIRGLPSLFVASAEFESAAEAQAQALGLDVARVFVPHPIQDRSNDEMIALAELALDKIVELLVVG